VEHSADIAWNILTGRTDLTHCMIDGCGFCATTIWEPIQSNVSHKTVTADSENAAVFNQSL
jgi:hypothetical protein